MIDAPLAAPPPLLLAQVWDNAADLRGWWMSEKLDGVRAWWDGRQFRSRQGNRFAAPAWFTEGLPDHPLDGEIWGGRQRFQHTVSVARRLDGGEGWRDLRYMVFDRPAPDPGGAALPFEARVAELERWFAEGRAPYACLHPHVPCGGVEELRAELERVTAAGGEGLMLRRPGSRYEAGRSWTLLKVKRFYDAEARVVEHQPGMGKHEGRLGALIVEAGPPGARVRFAVGTGFTDAERAAPPPVGAWISFRYQELTDAGVPRFPCWIGPRDDLTPEQMDRPLPRPAPIPTVGSAGVPAPRPARPAAPAAPYVARYLKPQAAQGPDDPPRHYLRLHWRQGASVQFWEIGVHGGTIREQYGREGREPHASAQEFPSADAALREADRRAEGKIGKGYDP